MNLIVTQFADNELDTSDTVGNRAFLSNLLVRTASLTLRTTFECLLSVQAIELQMFKI